MAGGFASAAIRAAADTIVANVPGAVLAGITAPSGSTPGYHWPRNTLPAGHYTVRHPRDQAGNPGASSGLDITMDSTQMSAVTSRFDAAIRARDPRLSGLAELVGTIDGRNIWSWHINSGFQINAYDDTHRWHVHVGGLRDSVEDFAAWAGIAAVFVGSGAATAPPPQQPPAGDWYDMATRKDLEEVVNQQLRAYFASQEGQDRLMVGARTARLRAETRSAAVDDANQAVRQVLASQEGQDRLMVAARTAALRPEVREVRREDTTTAINDMQSSQS